MGRCIPVVLDDGTAEDQDQAVAICSQMWRDRHKEASTMNRAYSILEVKAFNNEERTIEGVATTPSPDRMGDIVEPMGAKFALPMPLLWQHNAEHPVGHVTVAKAGKNGIKFRATIANIAEDGELKRMCDKAWQSVKAKLVRGISIGFKPVRDAVEQMRDGGLRFKEWEWLELSLVTIPANADCTISLIKSLDQYQQAASGRIQRTIAPGVPGHKQSNPRTQGTGTMHTFEQRIDALEEERAMKSARMEELFAEGKFSSDEEKREYRELAGELEGIDEQLSDLLAYQRAMSTARPVNGTSAKNASRVRGGGFVSANERRELPPGIRLVRQARVDAISRITNRPVDEVAKNMYGPDAQHIVTDIKADVPAASTGDANWAGNLVGTETSAFADFAEYLRPFTIVGRFGTGGIPSLRRVPFRTALISQTSGGAAYWVGEGAAKPLTSFDFARTRLEPTKVATIAAVTEELLRDSSPSAETLIRDQLVAALVQELDQTFIGVAAASGAQPAGIGNGVSGTAASGEGADDVRVDVRRLIEKFVDAENPPTQGVFVMRSDTALALGMMVNSISSGLEFPGITLAGGNFFGMPVITSSNVPAGDVYLINASDIYFADEGGVRVDMSREASLVMKDSSLSMASTTAVSPSAVDDASVVSMWQTNSVAFRAERTVNWMRRRSTSVALLTGVNWGKVGSPLA
jgi:HK97 family phage major capsid protein/HK97 family phage prohead protease